MRIPEAGARAAKKGNLSPLDQFFKGLAIKLEGKEFFHPLENLVVEHIRHRPFPSFTPTFMAAPYVGDSSQKSSTRPPHPGSHFPSVPPSNSQPKVVLPGSTGMVFGIEGTRAEGLNAGWQAWRSGGASRHNSSLAPATSLNVSNASQADTNFRGQRGESWVPTMPAKGAWDDSHGTPSKDFSPRESHKQVPPHYATQRQKGTAPHISLPTPQLDERLNGVLPGQLSSPRCDGKIATGEPNGVKHSSSTYPQVNCTVPFPNPQGNPVNGAHSWDPSGSEDDLSRRLFGLGLVDPAGQQNVHYHHPVAVASGPSQNGVHSLNVQPPGNHYSGFNLDYSPYFSNAPAPDQYIDYQYGYDPFRPPSESSLYGAVGTVATLTPNLYPPTSSALLHWTHPPPPLYFDFNGSPSPPNSSFYYHSPQTVAYAPHAPLLSASHVHPGVPSYEDRDPQFYIHPRFHPPQNILLPSPGFPHPFFPQNYGVTLEYNPPHPLLFTPSGTYGANPGMMQFYQYCPSGQPFTDSQDTSATIRSLLLDEFRADKHRAWELSEIYGHVVEFCTDQYGSRFLQQKLDVATPTERQVVFDEIDPASALKLMQDVFGNYVIQKIFDHGTQEQKSTLVKTMQGSVLPLSLHLYGCRVMQKAICCITPEEQSAFVEELGPHVVECVRDANGNHVVQRFIERVPPERLTFTQLVCRCFEHLRDEQTQPLIDELQKFSFQLLQDQFGNYVIQYILERGKPRDRALIVSQLHGHMFSLVRHKFASNVCEKALVAADSQSRHDLIKEMLLPTEGGDDPVLAMMKDHYANYVLQRALSVAEEPQKQVLFKKIKAQLTSLRQQSTSNDRHLVSMERFLEKLPNITAEEGTKQSNTKR